MELRGAHVLLTGASGGIGAAMAEAFASVGARLSLAARSKDVLDDLASRLDGKAFVVDLSEPDQVDGLIGRVESEAGPIDVLVNNAGVATSEFFGEVDPDVIRRLARVNFEAPMLLTRNVLPGMIERNRGHLVFTGSLAGTGGFPGLAAYGASKAGLSNFEAALRIELRDTAVGTTVLAPGPVDTAMYDDLLDSSYLDGVIKRLDLFRLIPRKSPAMVAERAVAAVAAERNLVAIPRRLTVNHWLREVPTTLTKLVLTGVDVGPGSNTDHR